MHLVTFLDAIGVALCAFLAVRLLVQPTENRLAARAFAAFLTFCVLIMADDACYRESWFARVPWFYGVANPFVVAAGPTFYVYVRAATERAFRWRWTTWLHFLPAALFPVSDINLYLAPAAEKVRLAAHDLDPVGRAETLPGLFVVNLYLLLYVLVAWRRLWRERESIAESQEEGRSHPLRGIGLFATLVVVGVLVSGVLDFTPWTGAGSGAAALAIVLTVFVALWTATQPALLLAPALPAADPPGGPATDADAAAEAVADEPPAILPSEAPAAAAAGVTPAATAPAGVTAAEPKASADLKPEEAARIAARLRRLFNTDRVFLDADLSLHQLAAEAKTTRHKLSAVLRQEFGATFYQIVAGYRVREAARLLESRDGDVRTIADIAFAAGFNTLSAFNAAFRGHFGVTPRQFRDRSRSPQSPVGGPATS